MPEWECPTCGWSPCPEQEAQDDPTFICDPQCIECIVIAKEPIFQCMCLHGFKVSKGWA
jgi:hypothetical protein